ncbi:MAG: penicillin-binding protein [Ignavibacteriaceae bacterium]
MKNSRALIVVFIMLIVFGLLVFRLVNIQLIRGEEYKFYAQRQQMRTEKIQPERGLIFDRNNTLLVYNNNDYSIYINTSLINKDSTILIAEKFSEIFGKSKNHYLNILNSKKGKVCIEKKASGEKTLLLKKYKIPSLTINEDPTRTYQYGRLASHVLGHLNSDFRGVSGIARSFDKILSGKEGRRLVERNAVGDMISIAEEQTVPAIPGYNIILTIDKLYQSVLEEELRAGLEYFQAESAIGIIMNPYNGEILALANIDDFDPAQYWNYSDEQRRNKAVTDSYEPGSTFKPFTIAALLDQNLCTPDEIIFVENGTYKFKNALIKDTHKHDYLSVTQILEESSNIGAAKLSQRIDDESFYKYLRSFGFGNYTSVDLPGEVTGKLRKPNEWSKITKAFISFGYGISVTPIQLITAFSTLINGGILYQPILIRKIIDKDGNLLSESAPVEVRRVISEKTSEQIKQMLVKVVDNGTGSNAFVDNVKIGGKTGTSKKYINGKYSDEDYNTSFIGFLPAEKPELVILIHVNSPKVEKYGGLVAAPVFKNIVSRLISNDPGLRSPEKFPESENPAIVPKVSVNNDDNKMIFAMQTSEKVIYKNLSDPYIMPNLRNLTAEEAIEILNKKRVQFKIKGNGRVVSQSIYPGSEINNKSLCILICE